MEISHAIVLGVVEGLTEFLPVSSTGHLILTAHLLGIPQDNFTKSFEISIQLGAILAVMLLYWKKLLTDVEVIKRVILAFLPTGILGFLLYKFIKVYLIGNELVVVLSLFFGGLFLLFADRFCEKRCYLDQINRLPYVKAVAIGLFQSLAMIPGVSRSGATIIGGMFMGLNRKEAAEFSFLLAIPTMLIATAYDLYKSHSEFVVEDYKILAIGFLCAFLTALVSVKTFLRFISSHSFVPFGVYRIFISIVYALFKLR
ncbi:undecaprenyl-diphosphatase UppP [Thermocrinis minervae]|uniref:Undecaprenyl-diphosphatase n=1 Tax=Thermocrinis minervae TaxID=381751 RepID=A0A1M6SY38_9AQUI|nr:undecaprenyl-diphosphatase UppP [Thermocrinis minervae]SHK49596.1 Undecaprenyl-diphosphatase [Thermocrinis minervae]